MVLHATNSRSRPHKRPRSPRGTRVDDRGEASETHEMTSSRTHAPGAEGAPLPGIPFADFADVYEPAYGACGAFVASPNGTSPSNETLRTCYLGDDHSTGRVLDLPETAVGHGRVTGAAVLAKSRPARNDRAYHYVFGDIRKREGTPASAAPPWPAVTIVCKKTIGKHVVFETDRPLLLLCTWFVA